MMPRLFSDAMDAFKRRLVAVGVVFCFGVLITTVVLARLASKKETATHNLPCIGQECQEIVRHTDSLTDPNVGPCTDFYRHVCFKWMKDTEQPSSYMADVARNFSVARHMALTADHAEGEHHELLQSAALFYRSCLAYLEKKVDAKAATDELFKVLNIPVSKWLTETDPEHFFFDVVHLSFVNRFHALLSVDALHSNATMTFLIRRQAPFHLVSSSKYHDHLASYVSEVVKLIGNEHASNAIIGELLNLDRSRSKTPIQDGREEWRLEYINCSKFPGMLWRQALEKDLSLPQDVVVVTVGVDAICKDLNDVLVNTKTAARPLYILALLSAHVLAYDYALSGNRLTDAINELCYHATAKAFDDVWLHLLSGFLRITAYIEEVMDAYMNYITSHLDRLVRSRRWMAEEDRSATLEKVKMVRMVRFYGGKMTKQAVGCISGRQVTATDFVSNTVRLYHRDVKNCLFPKDNETESRIKEALLDTALTVDRDMMTVVLPHVFAVPPMYYRHVEDDKFINIAVLGIQLARKVLSIVDRKTSNPPPTADNVTRPGGGWNPATLANYSAIQRCYARQSSRFHQPLTDDQFDDAFSVMDALRIAYAGKREYDREIVTKNEHRVKASNVFFFKRVCLSLCTARDAPPDPNSLDFTTAYASCLFAVGSMPQFAEAFGCSKTDPMWRINRCCVD